MCCWNTMKKANNATSQNSTRSETQRLYRHVQQISQRLDRQIQQALDWKEWFDVETLQLRQRVRDLCEHILLSGECDIARKAEEYLWRKAFYDIIQKLKTDKKKLTSNNSLNSVYTSHLQTASTFYHQLLIHLRNRYDIPVYGIIDWVGSPQEGEVPANITKEQTEWSLKACQRCLIYLGDISRYQLDLLSERNEETPERYYHIAILLNSDNGMPHNQIGTLKQNQGFFDESVYHYMRCHRKYVTFSRKKVLHQTLTSKISILSSTRFEGAEENLKRVLEKHNQKVESLHEKSLRNNSVIDVKTQFTASFLSLQEVLFNIRTIPTDDLAQWCQSLLSLFAIVLTNNLLGENGFYHGKTSPYTNGQMNGHGKDSPVAATNGTPVDEKQTNRIKCNTLLKMLSMNILDVVRLKALGSDLTSAATAFAAALLSQLLDFVSQYLKQTFPTETIDTEKPKDIDANAEYARLKKRLLMDKRKRRRQRMDSFNSEHSESADEDMISPDDDLSDLSEGEHSGASLETLSDDSGDSVVEEEDDDEDDVEVANITQQQKSTPPNGIHHHKHVSSLQKAGKILNKQLKKGKSRLDSSRNGIVDDFTVDHVEQATKLLTDFEKMNEEAYLPVIKIFFDWLKINPDIMKMSGKASPVLWQRVADVLNSLPSQKVVQTAVMCLSQRRRLPLWLKGDLDDGGLEHPQKRVLPEDMTMYGAPGFQQLHHTLDITWHRGLNNVELYQFALRVTYLRNFGHFICENEDVPCFTWDAEKHKFSVDSLLINGHHDSPTQGNDMKDAKVLAQRNQMMKALAKQKLKHDVQKLEQQLKSAKVSPTEESSVYLVLDTAALCRHLSLLRQLVKSANFVVIVPTQVIAALDELKKYNPGARDAIKFLEDEIKHGNRWLKTQKEHETVTDVDVSPNRKKKNRDIEEWRFLQVVKCCVYFVNKHASNSMVTLLTSESSLNTGTAAGGGGGGKVANMGTRPSHYALEICKNKSIQVEPVVDFYKRFAVQLLISMIEQGGDKYDMI